MNAPNNVWPRLDWQDWAATAETLHRFTQIAGKVCMALAPMQNHWWHVALYVTSRGLTTSPVPGRSVSFSITFDFIDHVLKIEASNGGRESIAPKSMPVS